MHPPIYDDGPEVRLLRARNSRDGEKALSRRHFNSKMHRVRGDGRSPSDTEAVALMALTLAFMIVLCATGFILYTALPYH